MSVNISNYDHCPPGNIEIFLQEHFIYCINGAFNHKELTETMRVHFLSQSPHTLDELEQCYQELAEAIRNKQFYSLIERIEKGERLLEQEQDLTKRNQYMKLMKALSAELENHLPKGA